jgi:hypothetical protein
MSVGMMPQRCGHGLNPRSCLKCFHAPRPPAEKPKGGLVSRHGIPLVRLPGHATVVRSPDHQGADIGIPGSGIAQATPEERAKHRGEHGRSPQGANAAPPAPSQVPYSSADSVIPAYDRDGLWEPPKRQEIIARQPRHPEAGK